MWYLMGGACDGTWACPRSGLPALDLDVSAAGASCSSQQGRVSSSAGPAEGSPL